MANEAPERIWANPDAGYCTTVGKSTYTTEYIRADLATLSSDAARDALTELDQLRERVKELEEALSPFVHEADQWEGYPDDENLVEQWGQGRSSTLTVLDLRQAKQALGRKP